MDRIELRTATYIMRAIVSAVEVDHAINAGESSAAATISMWVEFLLGQDVTASLWGEKIRVKSVRNTMQVAVVKEMRGKIRRMQLGFRGCVFYLVGGAEG